MSSKRASESFQVHRAIQFGKVVLTSIYLMPDADPCCIGNMDQLLGANAWDFHFRVLKECGRVARIRGLFGVGTTPPA